MKKEISHSNGSVLDSMPTKDLHEHSTECRIENGVDYWIKLEKEKEEKRKSLGCAYTYN